MGYLYADATDSNQLNPLLCHYWGKWTVVEVQPRRMLCGDYASYVLSSLVVLRGMKRDTVQAFTDVQDIKGHVFNYSKRYTGIPNAYGMRKPINRLGNAFGKRFVSCRGGIDYVPYLYGVSYLTSPNPLTTPNKGGTI